VRDGDVMFIGHLVGGPNGIEVYGRAIARRYEEGRDDASAEEASWLGEELELAFGRQGRVMAEGVPGLDRGEEAA
jgi:hypothetical protein